ncbi:MAG: VWA domain-containing protein [Anaerolineae bacterium]|nr:VWA domain-containing protein [Anaerolineae bacterium]
MSVTPNVMIEVARALEYINLGRRQDVYDTLRAMIVTRQRDLKTFDEAFRLFWQRPTEEWSTLDLSSLGEKRRQKKTQFLPPPEATPSDDNSEGGNFDPSLIAIVPTYSTQDTLRYKDFSEMSGAELAEAKHVMERLPWSLGTRETRRFQSGTGQQLDLRRSFRRNMRYAGEPLVLPERRKKIKPRPLVLLCDISGSMERYTRLLLHFVHTLASSIYQVESFVFSTRLSRVTRHLRHKQVDVALREVGQSVKDWGGGTRIGDSLHSFNYTWARRVLGSGAVVLLISDGWDRGEPDLLQVEAERLQRNCYRFIWLNPLLGSPEYEPLTRGAQAILPYVDDFLPIHNLASLETLVRTLWRVHWRRPERGRHFRVKS